MAIPAHPRTDAYSNGIAPLGIISIGIVPMGVVSIGVVPMGVLSITTMIRVAGTSTPTQAERLP